MAFGLNEPQHFAEAKMHVLTECIDLVIVSSSVCSIHRISRYCSDQCHHYRYHDLLRYLSFDARAPKEETLLHTHVSCGSIGNDAK